MTLAKAIMETGKKPDKTIIVALWTAEEEGLLGSRYYVQNLTYPLKNLRLNVNFDMISRYISDNDPKKVTMTYSSSCPNFKDVTVANLKKYGIDLLVDYQPSTDPPGGTDHRSFVAVGVPVMRFKPGHREEYHTPQDELSTIDWDIMEKIIKISFTDVWELANTNW
jgi:Zn-dependent M28 family amino/carboxypeptidase